MPRKRRNGVLPYLRLQSLMLKWVLAGRTRTRASLQWLQGPTKVQLQFRQQQAALLADARRHPKRDAGPSLRRTGPGADLSAEHAIHRPAAGFSQTAINHFAITLLRTPHSLLGAESVPPLRSKPLSRLTPHSTCAETASLLVSVSPVLRVSVLSFSVLSSSSVQSFSSPSSILHPFSFLPL